MNIIDFGCVPFRSNLRGGSRQNKGGYINVACGDGDVPRVINVQDRHVHVVLLLLDSDRVA